MAWTQEKLNDVYKDVQKKAATDKEFRNSLLNDATSAIGEFAGEALPQGFAVKAIENDPAYAATFVVPPFYGSELSDDELEEITGGCGNVNVCGSNKSVVALGLGLGDGNCNDKCGVDLGVVTPGLDLPVAGCGDDCGIDFSVVRPGLNG